MVRLPACVLRSHPDHAEVALRGGPGEGRLHLHRPRHGGHPPLCALHLRLRPALLRPPHGQSCLHHLHRHHSCPEPPDLHPEEPGDEGGHAETEEEIHAF